MLSRCAVLGFLFFPVLAGSVLAQELQSSQTCLECHETIVQDWQASRHAQSTPDTNPFYAAMLAWANESTNGQAQQQCDRCHVPVAHLNVEPILVDRLAHEGVTCDVCHATQPKDDWLELVQGNVKMGPFKDAISVAHESRFSERLTTSEHCLTCHSNLQSAHSFAFCSTEEEYKNSSFAKQGVTCQDCHMPAMEGRAAELGKIREVHTHQFYGGYNSDILTHCADLDLNVQVDSTYMIARIDITNKTVGHSLPTGSPMRAVYLTLQALDREGEVLWQNYQTNPVVEDTQAVFMRLLQDDAGNSPVPPWLATSVRFDQRLQPDETRSLSYEVPRDSVAVISATLTYRLAPPALLKKLNLLEPPYNSTVDIIKVEERITD